MKQGFDDLLGYNIIEIARKVNVLMNKKLEFLDITFPQYRIISRLWLKGELTQKELHEYLSITPATLTPMIKLLEKKNLIKRKVDMEDARSKKITLTDRGIEVREKAFGVIMDFEEDKLQTMGPEETQLLIKWLKSVNDNIGL